MDYPRPELDNTVNFLEAAFLSSSFRTSSRPTKPLKVVIAGAGDCDRQLVIIVQKTFELGWFYLWL